MPCKTLDLTGFLIGFKVIFFPNLRYLELMTYVGHPAWHSFFFNQISFKIYCLVKRPHADQFIVSYIKVGNRPVNMSIDQTSGHYWL